MSGSIDDLAGHSAVVMALTVAIFVGAQRAQRRWPNVPLLNPTLVGVAVVIAYLEVSGTSCQRYLIGTQVLSSMLAPTVVLLAVPLYRRIALIRASWRIILASLLVGLPAGILSALAIAIAFGAQGDTLYSLVPKSVTSGIAVGISESIGGIPVLTAAFVIMTGIFGAAFGPVLLRLFKIVDERAIGLAMGVGGHGIATARAFQISDKVGTFSSLAMALNGIATAILVPTVTSSLGLYRGTIAGAPHASAGIGGARPPSAIDAVVASASAFVIAHGLLILATLPTAFLAALACTTAYGRLRQQDFSSGPADVPE